MSRDVTYDVMLSRAIATAIAATAAVEAAPDERPADVSEEAWEAGMDRIIRAERIAQGALIDRLGPGPHALLLADGTVLAVSDQADGLAIVPPDRVRRLEG